MSKKEIVLTYYMKDILESHPVVNLKQILKDMKQDIGAYSKMKKADLVNKIIELKKKGYPVPKVEMYVKPPRKKAAPVQGPRNLVKGFGIKRSEKKLTPKQIEKKENYDDINKTLKDYESEKLKMNRQAYRRLFKLIEEILNFYSSDYLDLIKRLKKLKPKGINFDSLNKELLDFESKKFVFSNAIYKLIKEDINKHVTAKKQKEELLKRLEDLKKNKRQ